MNYIIYKLNFPNNKVYIGLTKKSLEERFNEHIYHRNNGTHRPIYTAMRKYKNDVIPEILEENLDIKNAEDAEKFYISFYQSYKREYGYNLSLGGTSGNIMSKEGKLRWKEKMQKYYDDPKYCKKITKHLIENIDSEKQRQYVNDYFSKDENRIKHSEITKISNNKRDGKLKRCKSKGGKAFVCNETGKIYELLQDAANDFHVDKRRIHCVLKYPKRYKTILRKYTFKYIE